MKKLLLFSSVVLAQLYFSQGFLKAEGQKIVNEKGENVLLRGLGLGGWMLQEGYMLKTGDFAGPHYQIEQKISELIGEKRKDEFYRLYLKNGITKADIDSLAKWGFNSVRLPMHYKLYTLPIEKEPVKGQNTWLSQGFEMTDELLKWCKANKMYLILDLHAAPGGQGNDANISDNDKSKPNLWQSEENQKKTIALWKKLADRYKDEPWIGGYDLINEPNYNFTGKDPNGGDEKENQPLWELQEAITKAIRSVDQKHLIIIEGNQWGNRYDGLEKLWDKNTVISFHKYWTANNTENIDFALKLRQKFNAPLWLGETGENSNDWFTTLIQLLEEHNIGYAFWPMKKIDNTAGIGNVPITPEYQKLLDYWQNGGTKPDENFSYKTLMTIADGYKIQNIEIRKDVIDALFRQVSDRTTRSFKKVRIPAKIQAYEYDLGRVGNAYLDQDYLNLWVNDNKRNNEVNVGKKLRNEGVDIFQGKDRSYFVGKIEKGEWLQYTINSDKNRTSTLTLTYANSGNQTAVEITDAAGKQLGILSLPNSGGDEHWKTATLQNLPIKKGENKIRFVFLEGGFQFKDFEIR